MNFATLLMGILFSIIAILKTSDSSVKPLLFVPKELQPCLFFHSFSLYLVLYNTDNNCIQKIQVLPLLFYSVMYWTKFARFIFKFHSLLEEYIWVYNSFYDLLDLKSNFAISHGNSRLSPIQINISLFMWPNYTLPT